ncbi:MAG: tRNA lysidine(34) synthetase TilS [Bacteroidota bacterium]
MNRSKSIPYLDELEHAIDRYLRRDPHAPPVSLIVGVSGGPDSMTLLWLLTRLREKVTPFVVHCNYRLRGRDSDRDQSLVEEATAAWDVEAISVRLDPNEASPGNLQRWARNRRYEIFRDLMRENDAVGIATAHHQDDQLETIFQKMLRGSGLSAWQGMQVWNGELFRPLLAIPKADLLTFASARHIPYRIDSSNEESTYARNFLRNGWFPALDDLFPGWRENLLKLPERAREHEELTRQLLDSIRSGEDGLDREAFLTLPGRVQRPLLLEVIKTLDPSVSISAGALERLDRIGELQTGKQMQLNEEWALLRDRDVLRLTRGERPAREAMVIGERQWRSDALRLDGFRLTEGEWMGSPRPDLLELDASVIQWPLVLREWREGDRFRPLGMKGSQSVADHLTNRKISSALRNHVRVLEDHGGRILAVLYPPGAGRSEPGQLAEEVRCHAETAETVRIHREERME